MSITLRNKVIQQIADYEHLTISQLAASIGKPAANLYDIQSGKLRGISDRLADTIIEKFPHYNKSWLVTGEGTMLVDGDAAVEPSSESSDVSRLIALLEKKDEQIDRLLTLLEKETERTETIVRRAV